MRYWDTTGGDSPGRIRERFAKPASAVGIPVETHCHNDLGMAVANSVSSATGKPLTDDELRLIAGYPRQLALLFPGLLQGSLS